MNNWRHQWERPKVKATTDDLPYHTLETPIYFMTSHFFHLLPPIPNGLRPWDNHHQRAACGWSYARVSRFLAIFVPKPKFLLQNAYGFVLLACSGCGEMFESASIYDTNRGETIQAGGVVVLQLVQDDCSLVYNYCVLCST